MSATTLITDVGSAKKAGLFAVWQNHDRIGLSSNPVGPDLTMGSMDGLVAHLASAGAAVKGSRE